MIRKVYLDAGEAIGRNIDKMVSFRAGMALGDLAEELSPTYQDYINKKNELVLKYGHTSETKDETAKAPNPSSMSINASDPGYEEAIKVLDAFLLEDIDVKYTKLRREDFLREDINGNDTIILRPFFKDPPVKKVEGSTPAADSKPPVAGDLGKKE